MYYICILYNITFCNISLSCITNWELYSQENFPFTIALTHIHTNFKYTAPHCHNLKHYLVFH